MVEPSRRRSVDSIGFRKLNQDVAAKQPFAAPVARPSAAARPVAVTRAPATAIIPSTPARHGIKAHIPSTDASTAKPTALPLKKSRSRKHTLIMAAAGSLLPIGAALAFFVSGQLHNKFSATSIVVSTVKASTDQTVPLAGQSTGRTNFLIYGMTEDGMRTDSIMLASYYYQQKKLVTLNIPRDLYVNDGYENAKMGEVYAYAKLRQPHNKQYPDQFVANLVSKEYNIPVNYWAELNMQGEVDLVNSIGGVNINVPDAFTDYEYPTWSYSGYVRPAPSFKAGEQHMDGATALIYSRSRHSLDNGEGSDFARSKRQGIVLSAIMTKVKGQGLLGNLAQLSQYLSIVNRDVSTSMSTDEMVSAAKLLKGLNPTTSHLIANWSTTNGFLCDSVTSGGADIVLYGVNGGSGSCTTEAGGDVTTRTSAYQTDSPYRQDAISYVQNLLQAVTPPPATTPASGTAAGTAVTASPATTTPASATSGTDSP